MTNRKTTRRALVMSLLSLLLCCSMLVGTTFAWFTDSVTSGKNKIIAGNLDVELYYKLNAKDNWAKVTSETELFDDGALWEPGYTQVVYLKVANEGTLALKYQLGVNIIAETQGKNVDNEMFKLSDYIEFDAIESKTETDVLYADRAAARAAVTDPQIISAGYGKASKLLAAEEGKESAEYVTLVVYMPEETNNKANYREVKPEITLGVNLVATQLTHESDSFNNKYDEKAEYLPAWNGEAGEVPEADVNGVITITTAEELAAFAAAVNAGTSYSGETVQLAADINLANKRWTPIGACNSSAYFQGTFDGQGHTIYGLNVDNSTDTYMYSTAGFFGWIDTGAATIKNVNISGATVKGSHWVGALVGFMTGTVENCTVTDSAVMGFNVNADANGDKIGGLVGYMNSGAGALTGNTVSNTSVSGYRDVAGLAGAVADTNAVKNNTVKDSSVVYEADYAAAIVSAKTAVVVDDTNTATNVQIIKGTEKAPGVVEVGPRSFEITGKEGLLNLQKVMDVTSCGEGVPMKVKLLADINLAGETWKPFDKMWVEFDGNGKTISNLKAEGWKAGLFGYLGGGIIKNLTLENVHTTGAQAGTFAGAVEGTIENCTLKGNNSVTYAPYVTEGYTETWGGIGAICGVAQPMVVNATIAEGATVTLNYGAIETNAPYVDQLTGYISKTNGTIVNNGKITANKTVSTIADLKAASASGANITLAGTVDLGGAAGNYLTLTKDTTITGGTIQGTGWTGELNYAVNATSGNIVFDGVTFDTSNWSTDGWATWGISVNVNGSANVTFRNCTFKGGQCPIYQSGADSVITLENCKFETTTVAIQCEIYSGDFSLGQNLIVKNCDFTGVADVLHIYDYDKNPSSDAIAQYLTDNGNTFTGVCKQTCK